MSSRRWQLRIEDILKAISSTQMQTAGIIFEEFSINEVMVKSVLYDFIVIGEASSHIPDQIRDSYPDIPWRLMIDMRNVMAHEYFQVNLLLTWRTIQNNLPLLAQQLREILQQNTEETM
jgi:uncharacterized protein with HEPN domain